MPFHLAVLALGTLSVWAASTDPATLSQPAELEAYVDAVVAHQPGVFKPDEDAVERLTDEDLATLGSAMRRLAAVFERRRAAGEPSR